MVFRLSVMVWSWEGTSMVEIAEKFQRGRINSFEVLRRIRGSFATLVVGVSSTGSKQDHPWVAA
jgi:hypothetical protein